MNKSIIMGIRSGPTVSIETGDHEVLGLNPATPEKISASTDPVDPKVYWGDGKQRRCARINSNRRSSRRYDQS
jgi:hypothetical protein